jgi:hypothetical protein
MAQNVGKWYVPYDLRNGFRQRLFEIAANHLEVAELLEVSAWHLPVGGGVSTSHCQ